LTQPLHEPDSDAPVGPPSRDEINGSDARVIRRGRRWKPDLLVLRRGDRYVVVKDYAEKRAWERLWGRLQVRHECRAYRWLGETPGIPELLGCVDAHALAIEYVEGGPLLASPASCEARRARFESLASLIARLEERGFVHLDLRGRRNLLLDGAGDPVLVDLGASVWLPTASWRRRALRPLLNWYHRFSLLKWKRLLLPESLSADDLRRLRLGRRVRALWLFNPLGRHHRKPRRWRRRQRRYRFPSGPYPLDGPAGGSAS
jgi:tRNA A-37 threonylcarbamoyl transferase component Bud32